MKKTVLISILLLFVVSVFAHEAVMKAPLIVPDGQVDEDGGWFVKYFGLDWSKADDYNVCFDITPAVLGLNPPVEVIRAWKQVPVIPFFDIRFGKDQYAFGRIHTGRPSKHYQIFDLYTAGSEMMVKLVGKNAPIGWQLYYANKDASMYGMWDAGDFGARFTYPVAGFNLGAAIMMDNTWDGVDDTDGVMHWEFDFEYVAMEMAGIDFQIQNIDDDNDDTDDMDFYTMLHYAPGMMVPIAGKMTPYFGYVTKAGMEENDMFIGANFMPKENAFIKLEYHMDSVDDTDDELNLQGGFTY